MTRSDRGFTLVEVMIALMIFGMIAAAGVALLSFSVRAQAAGGKALDDVGALGRLDALLTSDLAQAVDRPARDERGTRLPAFVGERGGDVVVRLVRGGWTNVDGAPRPSLQKVEYRLVGNRIERVAWPMVDGAAPLAAGTALEGVAGVAARYRFGGAWSDRWDGTQGAPLPQAMEIVVSRPDRTTVRALYLVGTGTVPRPEGADAQR